MELEHIRFQFYQQHLSWNSRGGIIINKYVCIISIPVYRSSHLGILNSPLTTKTKMWGEKKNLQIYRADSILSNVLKPIQKAVDRTILQ